MISLILGTESSQIHRNRKKNGSCQGLGGRRNEELVFNTYRFSVLRDKKDGPPSAYPGFDPIDLLLISIWSLVLRYNLPRHGVAVAHRLPERTNGPSTFSQLGNTLGAGPCERQE